MVFGRRPVENGAMRDSENNEEKKVEELRAQKAKLERVGGHVARHSKAEQKLQLDGDQWENTFNAISDWIVLIDLKGRILRTNSSGEKFTELSSTEIVDQSCCKLVHGSEKHIPDCPMREMIRTGQRASAELQLPGGLRYLTVTVDPITDEKGNIRAAVHIVRDITQHKRAERALRLKEAAIATSINAIAMADLDGILTYVNDAFLKMWGYKNVGEVLGKPSKQFWQIDERIKSEVKTLRHGGGWIEEAPAQRKDNSLFIVQLSTNIVLDDSGKPVCMMTSFIDITERKKAEQALLKSEEYYRMLAESINDGLSQINENGIKVYVNERCAEIFGYSPDEMIGRHWSDFYDENAQKIIKEQIAQREKGIAESYEVMATRKDGRKIYIRISPQPIFDNDCKFRGSITILTDITERKKAEEAIRQSERRFRTVVENSPDFIVLVKKDGIIFDVNHLEKGYTREMVIGQSVFNEDWYETKDQVVYARKQIEHVFRTGESGSFDYAQTAPGGLLSFYETRVAPFEQDTEGSILSVQCATRDITERKKAELKLKKSEANLARAQQLAHLGSWDWDIQEDQIKWSNEMYRIWGYELLEFIPKYADFLNSLHPDDLKTVKKAVRDTLTKKIPYNIEYRIKTKGNQERIIYAQGEAEFDEIGQPIRMFGTALDITERKQAEEALQESEELFRTYIEQAPEAIFVHNLDGRFLIANNLACKYTGYSKEALLTMKASDIDVGIIEKKHRKRYWEKLHIGEHVTIEGTHIRKDRSTYPAEVHIVKIILNEKPMILAFVRDITDRKRVEETLREREELLRATLESTADGILVVNNRGRVTHSNARMTQMWRVPEKLFEAGDDAKLLPFAAEQLLDPEGFLAKVETLYQSNDEDFDTLIFKDGRVFERYSCPLIRDGKNAGRVWSFRNITGRKHAEKSLLEYQEQLKSLASQLTLTEERERRRIATELHDQINQSLAISKIKLEELRHSTVSDESHKVLGEVCNWLSQTMKNTRSLTFDLSSPILYELGFEKAVAAWLEEEIQRKHNIHTTLHGDGKPKLLDDDIQVLLFRDVRELLINVVKHAHAKKVKVSIKKVDSMIQVRVEDDGIGFNPVEATAAKMEAFGLFSIRERLEHLGGHFEIDSSPGCGCRITMLAPLKQAKTNCGEKK